MSEAYGSVYVMGRTPAEHERLRRQAKALEPLTRALFEQAGLAPGMSCLDVGSGPGEVMRLMADFVGPTGRVVGLDLDGDLGRHSVQDLSSRGYTQCEFIEGDLRSLDPAATGQFDFVFARIVVIHLQDAILGLGNMYRFVKPGGRIAAQEYLFTSLESYPRLGPAEEALHIFFAVCEKTGRDVRTGLKLPSYFAEAGIGAPDGTDVGGRLLHYRESAPMLTAVLQSILPLAIQFGFLTQERANGVLAGLEHAAAQEGYYLWPLLVGAWKTKPV
ncbi:MAG TPA: methyltransferase domain-containing protein [Bryobacteraceae bacterium]|nr:methyltransferase domain-containing protein [Bryobacteraceae bacterium]